MGIIGPGAGLGNGRIYLPVVEPNFSLNNSRVINANPFGQTRFSFRLPGDFVSLIKLVVIGTPDASGATSGQDIDLNSDYAGIGENFAAGGETDTGTVYNFTGLSGKYFELDISIVFTGALTAGDQCGLLIDHNNITGNIRYVGTVLEYSR